MSATVASDIVHTLIRVRGMVLDGQAPNAIVDQLDRALKPLAGQRGEPQVLISIAHLLEELLAEVKRCNATAREGAVSSILIEDNPTKDKIVRISTKHYVGSVIDVDEALETHARAHVEAERRALNGWQATVDALAAERVMS